MAIHSLRHPNISSTAFINWALILVGVLVGWLLWPGFRS